MESLQKRYQKVTARFQTEPTRENLPANWTAIEHAGRELRFVDHSFNKTQSKTDLTLLGQLETVEARPLSLREIFVNNTRGQVASGKENS